MDLTHAGCPTTPILSGSATVTQPVISLTTSSTNSTCGMADGSASVVASGGGGSYTYFWSNGADTPMADDLLAGNYLILVNELTTGCSAVRNVTVSNSNGPTGTVGLVTDVSCFGGTDGAIDLNVTGGTQPYVIEWSTGANTEDIAGLAAGTYDVIVTDATGCGLNLAIDVLEPSPLEATISSMTSTCGNNSGSATVTLTGGTSPYNYQWSSGGMMPMESNLGLGVYQVVYTDANGCVDSASAAVSEIGGPLISTDSIFAPTCGDADGAIYITPLAGIPPITYSWNGGLAVTEDLVGVDAGTYFVQATDSAGCSTMLLTNLPYETPATPEICVVTVDSATQNNLIVWDAQPGSLVESYELFRETSAPNIFLKIATVPADTLSEYLDTVANTSSHWWRYKLGVIDSCGTTSLLSAAQAQRSINLSVAEDIAGTFTLSWNHYLGAPFNQYYIYRHTLVNGYELIDSVPSTMNTYTNTPPGTDSLFYVVDAQLISGCLVSRAAGNINSSRSNTGGIANIPDTIDAIDEASALFEFLSVYPNPNNGRFTLNVKFADAQGLTLNVFGLDGKHIEQFNYNGQRENWELPVDLSNYQDGIYLLEIRTVRGVAYERLIKH